jgi:hypothetical protein
VKESVFAEWFGRSVVQSLRPTKLSLYLVPRSEARPAVPASFAAISSNGYATLTFVLRAISVIILMTSAALELLRTCDRRSGALVSCCSAFLFAPASRNASLSSISTRRSSPLIATARSDSGRLRALASLPVAGWKCAADERRLTSSARPTAFAFSTKSVAFGSEDLNARTRAIGWAYFQDAVVGVDAVRLRASARSESGPGSLLR